MRSRYYHNHHEPFKIPTFRFIAGIIGGFSFSVFFYSFLVIIREVIRLLTISKTNEIHILSESELWRYNMSFAYLAVILGQAICFSLWFDRPKSIFQNLHKRNTTIVNGQRAMNAYFISWISKIVLVCYLFFCLTFENGISYLDFLDDYTWVYILLIIFLFFQSWNAILIQYKRKSFYWFLLSFAIVNLLSFGLAEINVINYKKINDIVTSRNLVEFYKIELPESQNYSLIEKESLTLHIYVANKNDHISGNDGVIIFDNKEVSFNQMNEKITEWLSDKDECEMPFVNLCYHIDKNTKMEFVGRLKENARILNLLKFSYAIEPFKISNKHIGNTGIFTIMLPSLNVDENQRLEAIDSVRNKIDISVISENLFLINADTFLVNQIEGQIYQLISEENDYVVRIFNKGSDSFQSYFSIIDATKTAITRHRTEYSLIQYKMKFVDLDEDRCKLVKNQYPYRFIEMSEFLK